MIHKATLPTMQKGKQMQKNKYTNSLIELMVGNKMQ